MRTRSALAFFGAAAMAAFMIAPAAVAQEMSAVQAQRFVIGQTFSYSCFDGTRGAGRIHDDGSVRGTIQFSGRGLLRQAALPSNTLRVKGDKICASLKGLMFEPCFELRQTGEKSFRGSVTGFGFAYCDFTRERSQEVVRTASRDRGKP